MAGDTQNADARYLADAYLSDLASREAQEVDIDETAAQHIFKGYLQEADEALPADEEWCLANGATIEHDGSDPIYVWRRYSYGEDGRRLEDCNITINDLGELWLEVRFTGCGAMMIASNPTRSQIRKLASALGVPLEEMR